MIIEDLVKSMFDIELSTCVNEIIEWHKTGILKQNGSVKKLADEIKEITNDSYSSLKISEDIILLEAARRFASNSVNSSG